MKHIFGTRARSRAIGSCWAAAVGSVLLAVPVGGRAQLEVTRLVDGVEARLERTRDFVADFVQVSEDPLNRTRQESGQLYLKVPRRMRWEYGDGQLFLSDGDTLYLYSRQDEVVQYEEVGDSFDERVPLMFLLGRPDLHQEFSAIRLDRGFEPRVTGTSVLRMTPKREGSVEEVLIEVDPETFVIRRLRLANVDGGSEDFVFSQIRTNTGLEDALFKFEVPEGVEMIEGLGL